MMEVTYTELALFCWGMLATAMYFKAEHERMKLLKLFKLMVENAEVREHILADYKKWEAGAKGATE